MCVTGPPSAPGNPISTVNETAVTLEWSPPRDTGGRGDVTYSVHCRKCSGSAGEMVEKCVPCGSSAHFSPRQLGLTHPRVKVSELQPRTNYTFSIEAVNGVSDLSPSPRHLVNINITTSQTGQMQTFSFFTHTNTRKQFAGTVWANQCKVIAYINCLMKHLMVSFLVF